jgi:hypothetical protein
MVRSAVQPINGAMGEVYQQFTDNGIDVPNDVIIVPPNCRVQRRGPFPGRVGVGLKPDVRQPFRRRGDARDAGKKPARSTCRD